MNMEEILWSHEQRLTELEVQHVGSCEIMCRIEKKFDDFIEERKKEIADKMRTKRTIIKSIIIGICTIIASIVGLTIKLLAF